MQRKYRRQWLYGIGLVAIAVALTWSQALPAQQWPHAAVALGWIAFTLFVWHFGIPAPYIGLMSLERVPQVGALLVFSLPVATCLNAIASLIWPFTNARYNQGSMLVASARAAHNSGMTALMTIAGGSAYHALGGEQPLRGLDPSDLVPIAALALAMQLVNIGMMAVFYRLDERDVGRLLTPLYATLDLAVIPLAVLTALFYNVLTPGAFALYFGLLIGFVLVLNELARKRTALEARVHELDRASRAGRVLSGAQRLDQLAERVLGEIEALFRYETFYLVLVDRARGELDFRLHLHCGERLAQRRRAKDEGLFGWVVEQRKPLLIEDWAAAPADLRERSIRVTESATRSALIVPLLHHGEVIGLISVQDPEPSRYTGADLNLMATLADTIAPAVADARAFEELDDYRVSLERHVAERTADLQRASSEREALLADLRVKSQLLERQSHEDALTGLSNRRHFDERLEQEVVRARECGHPLVLVLADLDHFKQLNDSLGHGAGDRALCATAAILRRYLRSPDLVARYGGEEFALLPPQASRASATRLCEQIRGAVEAHPWHDALGAECHITLSLGIAELDPEMSAAALVASADAKLYEAKRQGRNRVAA